MCDLNSLIEEYYQKKYASEYYLKTYQEFIKKLELSYISEIVLEGCEKFPCGIRVLFGDYGVILEDMDTGRKILPTDIPYLQFREIFHAAVKKYLNNKIAFSDALKYQDTIIKSLKISKK